MHGGAIRFGALACFAVALPGTAVAQFGYQTPSPAIVRILDAPAAPVVLISPDRSRLLMLEPAALPTLAESTRREIVLGGTSINPRNTAPSNLPTYSALIARPIGRGETRRIVIPWKARVANPAWSPDGDRIAFTVVEDAGISLWVAEASSGESRMIAGPVLNGAMGNPCQWLPGSTGLLCSTVVTPRPGAPDEAVVEQYSSSQLAVIPLTGTERLVGGPGLFRQVLLSPDGQYLLVESLHRPDSTGVPSVGPSSRTELWDLSGQVRKVIVDRGVIDARLGSADEVAPEPRAFEWRSDAPATLVWVEAQDGGNPSAATSVRDRVVQLIAPFTAAPVTLVNLAGRSRGIVWGRSDVAIVTEGWDKTGQTRMWILDPSQVGGAPKLFSERASEDRYADPGHFMVAYNSRGRPVLHTSKDGRFAFLAGVGASPEGDRPFLDRLELPSRRLLRRWRSQGANFEEAIALLDQEGDRIITRRESVNEPPNYFIRDLGRPAADRLSALTVFKDASPEFSGVTSRLITFKRRDGVPLSAMLYLPAGYRPIQGRLPFVLWANPQEFRSLSAASQVRGSSYRYVRPVDRSVLFFLQNGYGVLDVAALPIVTEGRLTPKPQFLDQLTSGAAAAVAKLVALGVADPKRIGVGSDSTSGAAVAELLEQSELFQAGISNARTDSDTANHPELFQPADRVRRPLLRIPPAGGGSRTREAISQRLSEMTSWMDKYLKAPSKKP